MKRQTKVVYREVQRWHQWWVWVLVLGVAVIFWYIFIQQIFLGNIVGNRPLPDVVVVICWILFGVVPIWFFGAMKLIIEVDHDGLSFQFFPLHWQNRKLLFVDMHQIKEIPYRLSDYGGLGIRMGRSGQITYNMSGKSAIEITLSGQTIVIGTKESEVLLKSFPSPCPIIRKHEKPKQ